MSVLLSLLHGTLLVLGVLAWVGVGIWLSHAVVVEGKVRSYWHAAPFFLFWPYLCLLVLLQLVWDWLVG